MNPPFRRTFEVADDTGQGADTGDDGSLDDLSAAFGGNQSEIGRRMLAATEDAPPAPDPVEPPPAAETPGEPAAAPVDGDVPPPKDPFTINEDGSITLDNGHTYANVQELAKAQVHAQQLISRGDHKQQDALPDPQDYQWDEADEEDDDPGVLAGLGAPLGGEPSDLHDLIQWAEQDITAATQWALQNQTRVPGDVLNALYAAWHQEQPAAADNYTLQLQAQAARMEMDEREARIQAMIAPLMEQQIKQQQDAYTAQLQALPHWESYFPRLTALVESDPELGQALAELSPADQFEEIYNMYARLRVDDSVRAQKAAAAAPVGSQPAAAAPPAPSADAPVVEARGGRMEEVPADDPLAIMRRGLAALAGSTDPFSGPPT